MMMNEVNVLTDRVLKRKREIEDAPVRASTLLSHAFTDSWRETEGLHPTLRRAMAFTRVLRNSPVVIRDAELIVGSFTENVKQMDIIAALDPAGLLKELEEKRLVRQMSDTRFGEVGEEGQVLREDCLYWMDNLPPDLRAKSVEAEMGKDFWELTFAGDGAGVVQIYKPVRGFPLGGVRLGIRSVGMTEFNPRVARLGLNGVIAQARAEMEKDNLSRRLPHCSSAGYDKLVLLRAIITACEEVIEFANRHAELARSISKAETDPVRKGELEKIAKHCEWVPANPPRTFWEALQSFQFLNVAARKDTAGSMAPGRLDQYLYPYYEIDLKEGRITRQEAAELLGLLWVKLNEFEPVKVWNVAPGSHLTNVTIGGRDKGGSDVTNEVSYLILDVMSQMKLPEPAVYVRYHSGMSREFMMKALQSNRDYQGGNPAFLNDQLGTARLLARGVRLDDAVDWIASGCLAYNICGISARLPAMGHLNYAKIFELVLYDGFDPGTGKQLGLQTGDVTEFTRIEQFYEAFEKQVDYFVGKLLKYYFVVRSVATKLGDPVFTSIFFDDYMTKGLGPGEGGGRYPQLECQWVGERGATDVADSIAAIKYLVFNEKKLTMVELLDALKVDWDGKEDIHHLCLNAPKYGNDDDYADDIFNYVSLKTQEIIQSKPDPFMGHRLNLFRGAGIEHVLHGKYVGTLPNGRKARTPLNDAGTSAMPSMDVKGPTALINSATKANHAWEEFGLTHNMKLSPQMLDTPEKLQKCLALLKTFFDRGGWHIQFNIVSREDLLDARKHPEKWGHLVVRVAGYSAYFVDLPPSVQDEIIARTEYI